MFGMAIISTSSYLGLSKIGEEIEEISQYQIPINTLITELEKDILQEEILTYELIIASSDVHSEEFKNLKTKIAQLEQETGKTIKEAEHLVQKAINHNTDVKTKNTYKLFLKELKVLEHEQSAVEKSLAQFEADLDAGNTKNLNHEKEVIHKELVEMDHNIQVLMKQMQGLLKQSTKQAEKDEKMILTTIEIISAITFLLSIILSFIIVRSVKSSIENFQSGFLGFFKFLNKESNDVTLLDDTKGDEMGRMAKILNENINKTRAMIKRDNEFLDEVVAVVEEVKQGKLIHSLDNKTSTQNLESLRINFNEMIKSLNTNIANNVHEVLAVLDSIGQLDFRNDIKNDKGKISAAINNVTRLITEMLVENKSNGLTLDQSSDILLENVSTLNKNSNTAAAALEETAAALDEITSTISSNTDNILKISSVSTKLTSSANEGKQLANQTTQAMIEIDEQVNAISDAISLIDQISFQTNILSLNAAVEAATAGESGKGFAVVAQEVRNLASRSAEVANEIKVLVENASTKANDGKTIASKMIDGYTGLDENILETTSLISDIKSASQEQKRGIEQINIAINSLDQQTQENASIASRTQDIALQTDKIAKLIVKNANEKEFHGKDEVQVKIV